MKMAKTHVRAQSNTNVLFVAITTLLLLALFGVFTFSFAQAQTSPETDLPTDTGETDTSASTDEDPASEETEEPKKDEGLKEEEEGDNSEGDTSLQALRVIDNNEPKLGSISGCKYFDKTDDETLDTSEPLSGWEFKLYQSPNAPWKTFPEDQALATAVTEEDGCYTFGDVEPGIYQVFETVQPGWVQTYPPKTDDLGPHPDNEGKEGGNVLPLSLVKTNVPNDPTPPEDDSIWNWINTKLFKNPTMMQILGFAWNCVFSGNCVFDAQTTELRNMRYYTVHLGTNEEAGEVMEITGAHFGNYNGTGSIFGRKFLDENKDGKEQTEEPGLEGWAIELYQYPNAPWKDAPENIPYATTTTSEDGTYAFENIPSGIYQVFEVRQGGWKQTFPKKQITFLPTTLTPSEIVDTLLVDDITQQTLLGCVASLNDCPEDLHQNLLGVRYYGVLLKPTATVEEVNFGNHIKTSEIRGTKFEDVDGDGVRDEDENGIAGWEIQLFQHPNAPWEEDSLNDPLATTTTDEDGNFIFDSLMPGVYQVYEKQEPDTWTQTAPIGVQPKTLPTDLVGLELVEAKLTKNPTSQKLLGCAANTTPCAEELHDELQNMKYFSVFLDADEVVDGADFGNQHKPLQIENEETQQVETDSIIVEWETDRFATSRVVYGETQIADEDLNYDDPNYGYDSSTLLEDTDPKVQNHSVTVTGLNPATTYYWRAISSASPEVIGSENEVTTPVAPVTQNTSSNSNNSGSSSSTSGGGSIILPPTNQSSNTTANNAPQNIAVNSFVAPQNTPAQNDSSNVRVAQVSTTQGLIAASDERTLPGGQSSETMNVEQGELSEALLPVSEGSDQLAAASFPGLSGVPLWGVLGVVLVLILIALRMVMRKG